MLQQAELLLCDPIELHQVVHLRPERCCGLPSKVTRETSQYSTSIHVLRTSGDDVGTETWMNV